MRFSSTIAFSAAFLSCLNAQNITFLSFSGNTAGPEGLSNVTYSYSGSAAGPNELSNGTLISYSGATAGPAGIPYGSNVTPLYKRLSQHTVLCNQISVYVLYYGAGSFNFFNAGNMAIIDEFIDNLSSTSYYDLLRGYSAGTVNRPVSYFQDCRPGFAYSRGCDLIHDELEVLIADQFRVGGPFARNAANGMYLVVAAPETTEAFGGANANLLVGRDYCAYHSYFDIGDETFMYGYVQVPNSEAIDVSSIFTNGQTVKAKSGCFAGRNDLLSPNGNPSFDMAVSFIAHELIEIMISPIARATYTDANNDEIMDKCQNWIGGLVRENGYDWNVQVGARKYMLPSIFDNYEGACSIGIKSFPSGQFGIRSTIKPSFMLTISGASAAEGAGLTVSNYNLASLNQLLTFDNGRLKMVHSSLCLDVPASIYAENVQIEQYACHSGLNQQWVFNAASSTISPKGALNMCLEVENGSTTNGAKVQIATCVAGSSKQKFTFNSRFPQQEFSVSNVGLRSDFVLDIYGSSTADGVTAAMYGFTGTSNQRFNINAGRLVAVHSGKCLQMGSYANGALVKQQPCGTTNYQKWVYNHITRAIHPAQDTRYCLDIPESIAQNSVEPFIYLCHFGANQQWTFINSFT